MIENIIKKMLRKWLKKKVHADGLPLTASAAKFNWVYESPLSQWRDRIWVVQNTTGTSEKMWNRILSDYLYL